MSQRRIIVSVGVIAAVVGLVAAALATGRDEEPSTSVAASGSGARSTATTVDLVPTFEATTVVPPDTTTVVTEASPTTATAPRAPKPTVPPPTTTTTAPWVPPARTCAAGGPQPTRGIDLVAVGTATGLHEVRLDGTIDHTVAGTKGVDHRSSSAAWEPTGRRLTYQVRPADWPYKSQLFVVDLHEACWRPVTPDDGAAYDAPAWSPDGLVGYRRSTGAGTDAFAPDKAMLEAIAADDPTKKTILVHAVTGPQWAPDGSNRVAFGDEHGLKLLDVSTGRVTMLYATTLGAMTIEWSPDARSIAFSPTADYRVWVVPADGSTPAAMLSPPNTWLSSSPSWSPDGSKLAFPAAPRQPPPADGTYRPDLWVMQADGTGARAITTMGDASGKPRWSPDGSRIAYEQRLYDGRTPRPTNVVVVDVDGATGPVVIAQDARLYGFFRRAG